MSNKTKAVLIILAGVFLVAIGVFASLLLIQRFQADQTPTQPQMVAVETMRIDVVIVIRDLFLGDRITLNDIDLVSVPVEVAPRTALANLEDAVGKIIKADLVQGQMVLSHNLADPTNKNQDLSFVLSDEHVLLAFPADDLMSSENMVQRGDIIDIFASITYDIEFTDTITTDENDQTSSFTRTYTMDALQQVGVTALIVDIIEIEQDAQGVGALTPGQTAEGDPTRVVNTRAYLLALRPQDALILKHLKDTGAIFDIVLRAPTSTVQFELTPVTEQFIIEFYGLEILP